MTGSAQTPAEAFGPYLPPVIGIVGPLGSGKSTLAKYLVETHGYTRLSMAAPLKNMLRAMGLSEEDVNGPQAHRARPSALLGGKSPRFALQTLGTDWGRVMISPDLWVNAVQALIIQHQTKAATARKKPVHGGIVIDDIRFPNEWDMVRRLSGVIWRIRRPEVERERTWLDHLYHRNRGSWWVRVLAAALRREIIHESEYHWADAPSDAEFWNTGTEAELRTQASALLYHTQP